MRTFLIASTRPGAGKTAIVAALAELIRRDGETVGVFKAVDSGGSTDGRFFADAFGGTASVGATLDSFAAAHLLEGDPSPAETVVAAARAAGEGKDVLLVEGPSSMTDGLAAGVSAAELAKALDAQLIVVTRYTGDQVIDDAIGAKHASGGSLLGVVINGVPAGRFEGASDRFGAFLGARAVPLLGLLPYDESLAAVSVRDLADHLGGTILNSDNAADALIEHVMVGTVVLGKASDYFRRRDKKAVIAPGHRPDMHLAALETDTRCIVLASNIVPNPIVLARAEEEDVPLILVKQDTLTVLEQIEQIFPAGRFGQIAKVSRIADLAAAHLDLSEVRVALGATV